MVNVLFVCMGNICRSPTAQGVFENLVELEQLGDKIYIDSAGTHAYHIGEAPDPRAISAAAQRHINISDQTARKVKSDDFERFDYVLAMDKDNLNMLDAICPAKPKAKVSLFLDFAKHAGESEVPDPYYGGANGFEHVLDLVQAASEGLLEDIKQTHLKV